MRGSRLKMQSKSFIRALAALSAVAGALLLCAVILDIARRPPKEPIDNSKTDEISVSSKIYEFLQKKNSAIAKVLSVAFEASNDTSQAVAGSIITFTAVVKGSKSDGGIAVEKYSDVKIAPFAGIIEVLPQSYAIDEESAPSQVSFAVSFFEYEKTFSYNIVRQDKKKVGSLLLVNQFTSEVPSSFVPEALTSAHGYTMAKEAADACYQMISDAKAEGVEFYVASSYRSYTLQRTLYDREAGVPADKRSTAPPGHSEHQTGLACDFSCNELNGALREQFEGTDSFKWLMANAHKYGFILRYRRETQRLTGYIYEPWHFRYIGPEAAGEYVEGGWASFDEFISIPR